MKKLEIRFIFLLTLSISKTLLFSQDTIHHMDYVRENNILIKEKAKSEEIVLIDISSGAALPTGKFANASINAAGDLEGGLAKPGYFLKGTVTVKLSDDFGINFAYLYQKNAFNEDVYDRLNSGNRGGYIPPIKSEWSLGGEFVGISYFIKSKTFPKLSLYLTASSGYVQCKSPEISVTNVSYSSLNANSIAFLGGAGFSYKFDDNIGLHLSANYLQTTPEFRDVNMHVPQSQTTNFTYIEQKITSLNIQVGLTIYMNRYIKK